MASGVKISRKVKEAARRYWLLGYNDRQNVEKLRVDFPDEGIPSIQTLCNWRKEDNWNEDLAVVEEAVKKKIREKVIDEITKMNEKHGTLFQMLDGHVQVILSSKLKTQGGKIIDSELTPNDLAQISNTLDRSVKNQRLIKGVPTSRQRIDLNFDELTDEQLKRIADGDDPQEVL